MYIYSESKSLARDSLVLGMLTTASIMCEKAKVSVVQEFSQPMTLYSVCVGYVSTKKSVCVDLFKEEYEEASKMFQTWMSKRGVDVKLSTSNNS